VFSGSSTTQTVVTVGARNLQPLAGTIGTVTSILPDYYNPGSSFIVSVAVVPQSDVIAYAIEDQLPTGWTASNISDSGVFDVKTNKVKWGLFFDASPRNLTYSAHAPNDASGIYVFTGKASLDGNPMTIGARVTNASLFSVWRNDLINNNAGLNTGYNSDDDKRCTIFARVCIGNGSA
jgi:hypothetical protein